MAANLFACLLLQICGLCSLNCMETSHHKSVPSRTVMLCYGDGSLVPRPCFYKLRGRKTGPGIHWQGPSAHALAITNPLGNRILLFVNLSVHYLDLSVNSTSSQTVVYVEFRTSTYSPCSLDQFLTSTISTRRLATLRYLPSLAEATMLTTYLYSRGAHSQHLTRHQ